MLYPLFFFVLCIHGLEGLLQEPRFQYYLAIPALIFGIDKLIEIRRSYVEVQVKEFKLLQSNILMIKMKRPKTFHYRSGQYIRIACPAIRHGRNESTLCFRKM